MKKPVIDRDECLGDGICEDCCPEVFALDDEDLAFVKEDGLDPSHEGKIQDAIDECPAECIKWKE